MMFGGELLTDRIDGCLYEDLDRLKRFRLMDDDFMSKVFDHNTYFNTVTFPFSTVTSPIFFSSTSANLAISDFVTA